MNHLKIEVDDNNQNIYNLNYKNIEVSNIIKNQNQNKEQETILNLNQSNPNFQINDINIYNSYNYQNPSIDNQQRNIIRNNIYPKSESYKYSSEIKPIAQKKKPKLINVKKINNNNPKITDYVSSNININDFSVNIVQTGKINLSNNKENNTFSKSKGNKKCRRICCKVLKIIGIILLCPLLSFGFIIGIFISMLCNGHVGGNIRIVSNCCRVCKDDDCNYKFNFYFKRKKRIGTS